MADSRDTAEPLSRRVGHVVREHPYITAIMLGCIAVGVVLSVQLLPADWALARRIAAGSVGGAGVGLFITAGRMIG